MMLEPQLNHSAYKKPTALPIKTHAPSQGMQPNPPQGAAFLPQTLAQAQPIKDEEVTLSPEAKSLAAKSAEPDTPPLKSFAYGALGMDHPKEIQKSHDDAYTAGQILSALGTIGAVLAVVV